MGRPCCQLQSLCRCLQSRCCLSSCKNDDSLLLAFSFVMNQHAYASMIHPSCTRHISFQAASIMCTRSETRLGAWCLAERFVPAFKQTAILLLLGIGSFVKVMAEGKAITCTKCKATMRDFLSRTIRLEVHEEWKYILFQKRDRTINPHQVWYRECTFHTAKSSHSSNAR